MKDIEPEFLVRYFPKRAKILRERQALREISTLKIKRSSDASVLFDRFAKRFRFVATEDDGDLTLSLRCIKEARGGGPRDLAFVLLSLFTGNGIECEKVEVFSDPKTESEIASGRGSLEHVLVYVPALDQYFDPTLRTSSLLDESGRIWLEEKPRFHFPYPSNNTGRFYEGKRSASPA